MIFREAIAEDIPTIFKVRVKVRENYLSLLELRNMGITQESVIEAFKSDCKGWVAESDDLMVGFSIANKRTRSVWALFVLPDYEGQGIGRGLLELAMHWLWEQGYDEIWLDTGADPHSRANGFYKYLGWKMKETTLHGQFRYTFMRPLKINQPLNY